MVTLERSGLISELNLSVGKAVEMRDNALMFNVGLTGFIAIADRKGMLLSAQVTGDGLSDMNVPLAFAKLRIVIAARRSSRLQIEKMTKAGINLANYADLGGGVAIFADKDRREFVGAVAFSGGSEEQDEQICVNAIETSGLFTDIPPKTEEASS